jgi:hypothetical protein
MVCSLQEENDDNRNNRTSKDNTEVDLRELDCVYMKSLYELDLVIYAQMFHQIFSHFIYM